jgi:hypothetical protein
MTRKNYCLPGETYVKGYKRRDGVRVEGYCRLPYIEDPVMDTLGFGNRREKLSSEHREYLKKQREKYLQEPKKFMADREKRVRLEEEYNMKMENE